jgi:hypothetical protein
MIAVPEALAGVVSGGVAEDLGDGIASALRGVIRRRIKRARRPRRPGTVDHESQRLRTLERLDSLADRAIARMEQARSPAESARLAALALEAIRKFTELLDLGPTTGDRKGGGNGA